MPKVFRLHDKGKQQIEGWQQSAQVTHIEINDITDPTGAKASKVVTSIPTPFARMHLFETAFDFVNADKGRHQASLYHELVSHYWDLFELLFNYPDEFPTVAQYDMPYSNSWFAGWDECFPTVGPCPLPGAAPGAPPLPDHGELWGASWTSSRKSIKSSGTG